MLDACAFAVETSDSLDEIRTKNSSQTNGTDTYRWLRSCGGFRPSVAPFIFAQTNYFIRTPVSASVPGGLNGIAFLVESKNWNLQDTWGDTTLDAGHR